MKGTGTNDSTVETKPLVQIVWIDNYVFIYNFKLILSEKVVLESWLCLTLAMVIADKYMILCTLIYASFFIKIGTMFL